MDDTCRFCGSTTCATATRRIISRRQLLRAAGFLGIATAAAPILAACQQGTVPPTPSGSTARASAAPKQGGQATMALFGSPGTSLLADFTNTGFAVTITQCVFQSLLAYNFPKVEIQPRLAQSYDVSSDGRTFTFHLRTGVKWSDGQAFTARDVEATVLAMTDPKSVTTWISYVDEIVGALERKQGKRQDVPGIQVVDNNTVKVTTINPSAVFLDLFGTEFMVLPKHVLDTIPMDQLIKSPFAQEPTISTGPFHIVKYVPDQYVELERNANYWGPAPYLDKVFIRIMSTDAGLAGIQRGEIDIIGAGIPPADVDDLKRSANLTITSYPFDTCETLYPNLKTAFGDVRVRQAMMYAIDRESIVKNVLQGYAKVAYSVFSELSPYYDASVLNKYPFDLAKAKQLLSEARWDSTKQVTFYLPTGDKTREQTGTVVHQQLAAAGINARLERQEFSTFVTRLVQSHDFDLAQAGNRGFNNLDLTRRFACRMLAGGVNAGGYCSTPLDSLLDQARATVGLEGQRKLTSQIQKIINEEAATVPLYYLDDIGAVNTQHIGGAAPHFGGVHRDIGTWYVKN